MDNNENVNWDKVNRGKVRYGFALELYKSGGVLQPSEMGKIEGFVDYVMEVVKTETEGSRAFVKGMVHMDAEGLKEPDLKRVLDALESGKITMVNLQDSLDRIQSIKDSYKK